MKTKSKIEASDIDAEPGTVRRTFEFSVYQLRILKTYAATRGGTLQFLVSDAVRRQAHRLSSAVNVPTAKASKPTNKARNKKS